jgi:hypothetical protein
MVGAGNNTNCHNYGRLGHYKVNCPQLQQPKQATGVCIEAEASSKEVQGTSPEEDVNVIDWDQPQGESDDPKYEEYATDIPRQWDGEEANVQEWDDEYDEETQTEYHNQKCMFTAKHAKNNVLGVSKRSQCMTTGLEKRCKTVNPTVSQKRGQYLHSGILVAQKHTIC